MGSFDKERYEKSKEIASNYFKRHSIISSPCLGDIHLNSDGFMHLISSGKKKRDWKNQVKRFDLVKYAEKILGNMGFHQEYQEQFQDVKYKKKRKSPVYKSVLVRYWAFIAVIDNKIRVKLIVKQAANKNKILWSVVPFWKSQYYKDIKVVSLYTEDMATN